MQLLRQIHKKLFADILYEQREFRVEKYNNQITVKFKKGYQRRLDVEVYFKSNDGIEKTELQISKSNPQFSINSEKVVFIEILENDKIYYRFGNPDTCPQYILLTEDQYESSELYTSKYSNTFASHINKQVYKDDFPEAIDLNGNLDSTVVLQLSDFSNRESDIYFKESQEQPLCRIPINNPSDINVYDLRSCSLSAPNLKIDLPRKFSGDIKIANSEVNVDTSNDFAVIPSNIYFDKMYKTLDLNESIYPIELDVSIKLDGFSEETKTVYISNEDLPTVSFSRDELIELGTIYFATSDPLPNLSARSESIGYYEHSTIGFSEINTNLFSTDSIGDDPNHTLYKINDVEPNEDVKIHYGFDGISVTDPSLTTLKLNEGEALYEFVEINYPNPLVNLINTTGNAFRFKLNDKEVDVSQYDSETVFFDEEKNISYSVYNMKDISECIYSGSIELSSQHRSLVKIEEDNIKEELPREK